MYCRFCGRELDEGSTYCPKCGFSVDPVGTTPIPTHGDRKERRRTILIIAIPIVLIFAITVAFVGLALHGPEEQPAYWVSDDVYVTGALADGTFTVTDEGESLHIVFYDFDDNFPPYIWHFVGRDGTDNTYRPFWTELWIDKAELPPGEYTVWVEGENLKDHTPASSAAGVLKLYGTVTDTFQWEYMGYDFSASVSYELSHYDEYAAYSPYLRTYGEFGDRVAAMTATDATITSLEKELRSAYLGAFGTTSPVDGKDYADFILGFVQICFDYFDDMILYGCSEYWAFPIETLYHGGGDCEDTSFLCAVLFDAAGYDSGMFIVPGHALAAVALDQYSNEIDWGSSSRFHIYSYDHGGETFYGCETTLSNPMPTGVISKDYTITSDGRFQYLGEGDDPQDGLYLIC